MCLCVVSTPLCFGQVVLFQHKLDHISCFLKSDDGRELALFIYGADSPAGAAERLTARGRILHRQCFAADVLFKASNEFLCKVIEQTVDPSCHIYYIIIHLANTFVLPIRSFINKTTHSKSDFLLYYLLFLVLSFFPT